MQKFQLIFILFFLVSSSVNAQQKEKRGEKGQQQQGQSQKQGGGKRMGEITIPNGNLIMGSPTEKSIVASVVLETDLGNLVLDFDTVWPNT